MNCFTVRVSDFSLAETLECGQCFRWRVGEAGRYTGVVGNKQIILSMSGNMLTVEGCDRECFDLWLKHYLGLGDDYKTYKAILSRDATLAAAIVYAPGIRVMHQSLWETLCSFIISQNNHIPRIMGIVDRLCSFFGTDCGGYFTFPAPDIIAPLCTEDLAPLRAGFRAAYIIDAAQKCAGGAIDEAYLKTAPLDKARDLLMQIKGVGPKVADCTLLFGAGRYEAFPEDVWIKRAMSALFPGGLPEFAKPIAGIAQQYIFHYARTSGLVPK